MKFLLILFTFIAIPAFSSPQDSLTDNLALQNKRSAPLTDFYIDKIAFSEITDLEHVQYIRVWFLHWSAFNDEVRVFIDYGQMVTRPNRTNVMTASGDRINFNSKAHVINSLVHHGFELIQADTEEYYFRKK